jgi:hypothetical protein
MTTLAAMVGYLTFGVTLVYCVLRALAYAINKQSGAED